MQNRFLIKRTQYVLSAIIIASAIIGLRCNTARADEPVEKVKTAVSPTARPELQFSTKLPDTKFDLDNPARFDLPPLPARAGLMPVLRARIVIINPPGTGSGFNYLTSVVFNGAPLKHLTPAEKERLLLRPFRFKLLSTDQEYDAFNDDHLATMFAENADVGDSMTADNMGATFTLDISDVARGVEANTLELRSKLPPKEGTEIDTAKAVDIEVGYLPISVRPN